jgi:exosortase/archaeosortase family protein
MKAAPRSAARRAPLANPLTRFVVLLVLYWAAGWLLIALVPAIEHRVIAMTARSLFLVLRLVGLDPGITGHLVSVGTSSLEIISECTSLVPSLLLTGAIAAYPASARARLIGGVAGLIGLWLFNVVRLIVLVLILMRAPGWFDFAHVYLWQTVSVLAAAALFALWLRWAHPER